MSPLPVLPLMPRAAPSPPPPQAARAWSVWEGMTSKLIPQGGFSDKYAADDFALAFARIENTFFVNGGWFESETWHFDNMDKIRGKFPIVIVQVSCWNPRPAGKLSAPCFPQLAARHINRACVAATACTGCRCAPTRARRAATTWCAL